jgi:phage major head subunit gpT-like protein
MPSKPNAPPRIILAAEQTTRTDAKITGVAYSGGFIGQSWSGEPVVVELAGMKIAAQVPLMYNHYYDPEYRLGQLEVTSDGKRLTFEGEIDADKPLGAGIIAEGRKWDWQASIGADVIGKTESLEAGDTTEVNGKKITGPATIVRKSFLREVSVVALGADSDTHIRIAAGYTKTQGEETMTTEKEKPTVPEVNPEPAIQAAAIAPTVNVQAAVQAELDKYKAAEKSRRDAIVAAFGGEYPELLAQAVTEGWTVEAAKDELLKKLRAAKPSVPGIFIPSGNHAQAGDTIHAAALLTSGVKAEEVVAQLGAPAVEAAQKRYRSGMSPKRLVLEAALANGFTDTMIDGGNWYQAAAYAIKAQFSNVSLTGILADVYNKRLLQGFRYADASWREIATIGSVSDFKAINSYRLNMVGGFEEVGAGGELHHATLSDESYSNQAKTYGKMLGLTRQDIINDDMGALSDVPFMFGRAAANSFNDVFWTKFLDDAAFFAAGNSNLNATASELSVTALDAAEQGFMAITAADGKPTGIKPAILLTPVALKTLARQLFNDQVLGVTSLGATNAKAKDPISNPFVGMFKPVFSPYLTDTKDYYLLADPMDCPVIQAVFLNGRQEPFVESSAAEFNTLGILYRAYMDWGVALQDPKGGYKAHIND